VDIHGALQSFQRKPVFEYFDAPIGVFESGSFDLVDGAEVF
jgi:hypothetical protein